MGEIIRKMSIALTVALFIGCGGGGGGGGTPPTSQSSSITTPDPAHAPSLDQATIDRYLKAINDERTKAGGQDCGVHGHFDPAPPLTWSDELYYAAYEHSYDMAKSDWWGHDGSGTDNDWTAKVQNLGRGSTVRERIENNNYTNWRTIGENIAGGTVMDTPEEAVDGWMNSPDHCKNIMNPNFKEVGMAVVQEPTSSLNYYWTQDFGAKW